MVMTKELSKDVMDKIVDLQKPGMGDKTIAKQLGTEVRIEKTRQPDIQEKMADNIKKLSKDAITEKKHEADLPLPPPPPDTAQPSVTVSGGQEQCFMPPPPPKESFSKFYEQRQVNELKRLYRHMHPELRKNLEHAVSRDISELLSNDEPNQQASVNLDAVLPGEVQSMRWIFENWKLDTIGEHQANRKLTEEEAVLGGNVRNTSLMFQGQTGDIGERSSSVLTGEDQTKGDVKTALWLFETQPLDSLNKIYPEDADLQEAVLKEPVEKGDVKGTKVLFETQSLDEVGRCNSVEEHSLLQLKSEIQELKGDVSKTIKYFQTEPLCAIRDKTGIIHEIKSICREETQSNDVNTARWLFETQPLDTFNKDTSKVQVIRGISLEEIAKGGVNATKWIFETQPLDTIKENIAEGVFQPSVDAVEGVDVNKQCSIFEKQPLDSINEHTDSKFAATEEILPGDVKSTLWLFETQPMENLKGSLEVGQLKKVALLNEERGAVQQRKHVFETCSLDKITNREEEAAGQYVTGTEEIMKGDVKSFKTLFETLPHESAKNHKGVTVSNQDEIRLGNVKTNQALFESTPLYAIEDSLGNYHEVTSVSREQVISGDVKNYKWMFETRPLDQFNESVQKVDIIKGITKQEILSGDVGTVKWMFETQPVDVINSNKIEREQQATAQKEVLQKGDVNQCRWLFETQPIDQLYDKENKLEKEPPVQGNVNSHTWMFETQPLDSIGDSKERYIKVSLASPDSLQSVNVKTTKHLFETEPLDRLSSTKEQRKMIRYSSRVEIQSGEVSRVKEIFESKPNVSVPLQKADIPTEGNIPAGAVNKFTWLFENCPMDSMSVQEDGIQELPPEKNIEGGDVGGKKFIFETYALDQIHQDSDDKEICKVQEAVNRGEVKSCTMLFETKPLYAIQDKGGIYHEVTSVKKEEIQKGDVKGAKWLFETKPLDMIHKDEEVFVIRAVTQEDIEKGCVKSARWRFETEPLDSITDTKKHTARTVDDVQKGDVQVNRQLFESQNVNQKKYVRLVSVSDVQKGNVRTSTWLFENQPIDCLKGEDQEHGGIIKVQREDNQKGDVKRCTWLFESQPLDTLKETESPAAPQTTEEIPKDNVKSTTWLFESTPLDKFDYKSSTSLEQKEISVKDTLDAFLSHNIIQHKGIVIENNTSGNVKMIKYQLSTQTATDIQKEEIVGGNLQRILIQLLHRAEVEPHGLLVEENSSEQIIATKLTLLNAVQSTEQEEHVRDNVAKALKILLNEDASKKTGIIMEESESGSVKIIIYALSLQCKFNMAQGDILKGNVKSTIGNLLASGQENKCKSSVTREQNEKGNVHLFTSCIEKGDLGYLKSLQEESELDALACSQIEPMQQETKTEQCEQSADQSKVGSQCVFVTSTPIFHPEQPHKSVKECAVDGNVKGSDGQASSCCKIEKRNICLNNTAESNTTLQKSIDTKQTSEHQNTSMVDKKVCVVGSTCNTSQNNSATGTDLQAALLDLRQATAEARTIQKQAQCKIQSSSQEIHLTNKEAKRSITHPVQATLHQEHGTVKQTASVMTTATETKTSYASLQTSSSATKKVSVSEEEKPSHETKEIIRAETNNINNNAEPPKCAKNYLNPFSDCDYRAQIEQDERDPDIVRGDVKAAIRALQNASKEQKEIEKEEVVKGNLSSTLESLQKSNVNVSKGDFKAAMIYRNAGQSYATCKRNSDVQHIKDQAMAKSMQPSDNNSPPSPAPVTEQEVCQALTSSNVEATKDDPETVNNPMPNTQDCIAKACRNTVDENTNASQTCQMVQRKKPALPPKPKHLLPGVRPPPRHKNKAFLATSSPVSSPSTPSEECCFKDMTEPANMTMKAPSPSNVPNACMYSATNINSETEKEISLPHEHKLYNQNNVVTSQDQTYQEESVIKLDQKNKESVLFECNTTSNSNLHTMSECLTRQSSEHDINKENLSENFKSEEVSNKSAVDVTQSRTNVSDADSKNVVMRVKRNKESEDARRQRLSIHMDEIMKGNIRTATDIFENLRKQDELEKILEKVTELEEKSSTVDVKSMRGLFETVPDWVVSSKDKASPLLKLEESQKDERFELQREDSESVSSVELAFEDLERASAEIKHLKEQTLAKILDIEETVKKALYAVSNLKSDSDIVSLSGLFRESLGVSSNTTNNIRKISIVSSKAKPEKPTQLFEQKCPEAVNNQEKTEHKKTELEVTSSVSSRLSPTSPSYITIESAARKTSQHNSSSLSSATSNQGGGMSQGVNGKDQNGINSLDCLDPFHQWSVCDNGQSPASLAIPMVHEQNLKSPSSPNSQRQKSVLELKTGREGPKVIGTTIVTEKYEESDQYGNKIVKSKTSTTVTKQSDTHGSSTFEFVSAPPRYEVTASPILRRHVISSVDHSNNKGNETGVVFVTFGNSKK